LHTAFATQLHMSTSYHPQTDGQTERMNRVLQDVLRHYIGPFQANWEELLPMVEFSINNSLSETTGATPFFLNYGQHPDTPEVIELRKYHPDVNRFIGRWSESLQRAKACILAAQSRQKHWADKKRRDVQYSVGDKVLLGIKYFRLPKGRSPKLSPRFVGPFRVCKVISDTAYRLELPEHLKIHDVFHVSALHRWEEGGAYQPPPPPMTVDGELEYEVDWIELTRYAGKRRQYLVHWLGYGREHSTWEPLRCLTNCPDKIRDFWSRRGEPCPHDL
jgi:Chromo (CHRromatin Organisation MOdifier) domain